MKRCNETNEFLYAKNIFERITFYSIEELNELTDSMYSLFDEKLDAHENHVKKSIEKMPEQFHDEFFDSVIDEYSKYAEGFPSIAGYLLLVRYYSLLEYILRSICQHVQHGLKVKLDNFANNQGISLTERCVKYLKDEAGFNIEPKFCK